jgi:hypothetical protein
MLNKNVIIIGLTIFLMSTLTLSVPLSQGLRYRVEREAKLALIVHKAIPYRKYYLR